ncbi:STAS domain-containing protein [Desulfosarcina ovata]|uniref:Anti-sigma factor antagonist n=1 Tax=Desulfosarcina ovata subsp. ovata TaxID=2752305 RepID=A0A5K8AFG0_9BACT|nr:STAS domain-containing protein [Desulfosarcina ovata]BBO91337.1 anti-sigma factor antagonist [Desulfosarcina ovata subsp. ovata]
MEIDFRTEGATLVAIVRGRMDTVNTPAFEKAVTGAIEPETTVLAFDLSGLNYICSAGLRVFLSTGKTLKSRGGQLLLAESGGPVRKVFQISGFFTLFKHFDTLDAALAQA